jgi:predicted 2-oxoglutarate/Fe(II)-dependent dioxygenase YbiX
MGGRFVLFCVIADVRAKEAAPALASAAEAHFDEVSRLCAVFVGDPRATEDDLKALPPTRLVFNDPPIARACRLLDSASPAGRWLLLDPSLRVIASWPLQECARAIAALAGSPEPGAHAGAELHAPVLIVPRVFEPDFCKTMIQYYERTGGEPSGVTKQDETGKTYVQLEDNFKRRDDCLIRDEPLRKAILQRKYWRLTPEVEKAFMWKPTRIERYLVARYDAKSGGFFRPHRDNTTAGTAHRRFAVTLNLNAGEYEGGDLRFPEFGARTYRAPTGGAFVFSCGLLHEATPVTRGARYAFLPFLYDEDAAKVRLDNNKHLDNSISPYRG